MIDIGGLSDAVDCGCNAAEDLMDDQIIDVSGLSDADRDALLDGIAPNVLEAALASSRARLERERGRFRRRYDDQMIWVPGPLRPVTCRLPSPVRCASPTTQS